MRIKEKNYFRRVISKEMAFLHFKRVELGNIIVINVFMIQKSENGL